MIVVIDNYDSFTYNLVQYLGTLGASIEVYRNDAIIGSSPEMLVRVEGRTVETFPIAGTRPTGATTTRSRASCSRTRRSGPST